MTGWLSCCQGSFRVSLWILASLWLGCASAPTLKPATSPPAKQNSLEILGNILEGQPKGRLSREVVLETVNAGVGSIQRCYEKALFVAQQDKTTEPHGEIRFQWKIKPDGSVTNARVLTTTLNHPKAESCMLSAISRWQFDKPEGGHVVVTYPFNFSKVPLKEGNAETPGTTSERATNQRDDESESIVAVISERLSLIRECYEDEREASITRDGTELRGTIEVEFTIRPNGRVKSSDVIASTMKNRAVEECIQAIVAQFLFEPTDDGKPVTVAYPFIFTLSSD